MTQQEVMKRVRACEPVNDMVQTILGNGGALDVEVLEDMDGHIWLHLVSDTCMGCGLPNSPELVVEHIEHHIQLAAYCKDCTASLAAQMRAGATDKVN